MEQTDNESIEGGSAVVDAVQQDNGLSLDVSGVPEGGNDKPLYVRVRCMGIWTCQFSDEQLRQIAQLIAGKNRQETITLLLAQQVVSQVAMTVSGMEQTRSV